MRILFFLLVLCTATACSYDKKEHQLDKREKELATKESLFVHKEAEYQALLKMRDSIFNQKDSMQISQWPADIAGKWTGKVICTESSCNDYAIGDQRVDTWEFASDSTQLVTRIYNNNNIIRVYAARYDGKEIKLNYRTDSASAKKVDMNVTLNDMTPKKIRGTRSITINNHCTAKFNVELVRQDK